MPYGFRGRKAPGNSKKTTDDRAQELCEQRETLLLNVHGGEVNREVDVGSYNISPPVPPSLISRMVSVDVKRHH